LTDRQAAATFQQLRSGGPPARKEDRKLTHNSAWLNREGDYLGFGDLSRNDMVRIALGIEPGELFVVLPDAPGQRGMAARVRGSMPACRPIACKPGTGGRTQGKPAVRLSSVNLPEAFAHRVWQSLPNRRSTAEFR
jgi:hypothetical protein